MQPTSSPHNKEEQPSSSEGNTRGQLDRLSHELHAREQSEELQERQAAVGQLGIRRKRLATREVGDEQPVGFTEVAERLRRRRRRAVLLIILGILLVVTFAAAVAGTMWYRARQHVTDEQIHMTLTAPAEVSAGDAITYEVVVQNNSHIEWQNVEVVFEEPVGFQYASSEPELARSGRNYQRSLGSLGSGESVRVAVHGFLVGEQDAAIVVRSDIHFSPANFPSGRFTKSALATTRIVAVPVTAAIVMPQEAALGERVLAQLNITNKSTRTLAGVFVQLQPAVGMKLATDDPQFSTGFSLADQVWHIDQLDPLETVQREVVLYLEGAPKEQRTLEVITGIVQGDQRYVQQKVSSVMTIAQSELLVQQRYQKQESPLVVRPAEVIEGVITYTNIGTIGLKNVVVQAKIEGEGFDPASLKLSAGAYDPQTRTITWTSATVPELALVQPQSTGQLSYQFAIKVSDAFGTATESQNNTVVITASVDSPDVVVPVGQERIAVSDRYVMSVSSVLTLSGEAFYDDGRLGIQSSGPVPPKTGEQTTYTVHLRLGSTLNDVGNVRVVAVLPDGVAYTGSTVLTAGTATHDERTGEVVWTVPHLLGLTGRAKPAADFYFQVAIRPGEHLRGKAVPFLNRLTAHGTDLFTDEELQATVTTYPSTETAVKGKGIVE